MARWFVCLAVALLLVGAAVADGGFFPSQPKAVAEPSQKAVVLHRDGVEDLLLQVRYEGARAGFAWIVPTPGRPAPGECSRSVFADLDAYTQRAPNRPGGFGGAFGGAFGGGGVQLLERTKIGVYDVSVLDADDPRALGRWLAANGYPVSPRVAPLLADYINRRWFFIAMRVDPSVEVAENDRERRLLTAGELHPIRLTFATPVPIYPLKISSMNGGITELLLYLVTDTPVDTRGFTVQFQRIVPAADLNRITQEKPSVSRAMWLTRLWRKLPASAMTRDVGFQPRIAAGQRPTVLPR